MPTVHSVCTAVGSLGGLGWAKAARYVFSIPPTSASSERVFALLTNLFGDMQGHALSDYIQTALRLRFNKRRV